MRWFRKGASADAEAAVGSTVARFVERQVGTGSVTFELARERASALRLTNDARVVVPERVVMRAGGAVVATMPRVEGIDLGALLASRGNLSVGECVYLGQQMCGALASLHNRGIAHGDVSPANVMIGRDGVTVVDTVAGALPGERGTRDFCAPERDKGASPPADLYSVGAVLAACVDPEFRQGFMGWLDPLLDVDPERRPHARGVELGLPRCATPVRVVAPDVGLVGELRAHAHEPHTRTSVLRSSRPWRLRRLSMRAAGAVAVALAVAGAATYVIPRADTAVATGATTISVGASEGGSAPQLAQADPLQRPEPPTSASTAARQLTNARFVALADGDADELMAIGAPEAPVSAGLGAQAAELAAGDLRFEGLAATVVGVEEVDGYSTGETARVAVTYVVSAHTVWHRDAVTGALKETAVDAHSEEAQLELRLVGATWLVERVLPRS